LPDFLGPGYDFSNGSVIVELNAVYAERAALGMRDSLVPPAGFYMDPRVSLNTLAEGSAVYMCRIKGFCENATRLIARNTKVMLRFFILFRDFLFAKRSKD